MPHAAGVTLHGSCTAPGGGDGSNDVHRERTGKAMARFSLVVYSNPVEGREQEYNDWYSNQHLSDLLAIPGVISARRFKLSGTQIGEGAQTYQYLAIYEVEADDVPSFLKEMMARTASGAIPVTSAMSQELSAVFWDAL
jgi:hypothetical protein